MSTAAKLSNQRRWIDQAMRWAVTAGGSTILLAIIAIFVYLLWTVAPILKAAEIHPQNVIATAARDVLLVDMNETGDVILRVSKDGIVEFYSNLSGEPLAAYDMGLQIRQATRVAPTLDQYALLDKNGRLWLVRANYQVNLVRGLRKVKPQLEFAYSNRPIALGVVDRFDVHLKRNQLMIASTEPDRINLLKYEDVDPGIPLLNPQSISLDTNRPQDHVFMGSRNEWIYLIDPQGALEVIDVADFSNVQPIFRTQLVAPQRELTTVAPLLGRYSLMVADDRGILTQWFVVRDELGFRLQPVRRYELSEPAQRIVPEPRRKGFVALSSQGLISLGYPNSERVLVSTRTKLDTQQPVALSPRANYLAASSGSQLFTYAIDNPHPEISVAALWSEIWYEGYSEPVYSWQSSSADNDFEPKFSLSPLLFGTIKAALYALAFAIPLAIMGAAYTAYFMHPALRAWIKPTIEIMAALPTVILGFIGGLWLAPIVEENLSGVLSALVFLPLSVGALSLLWPLLPPAWSRYIEGRQVFLIIPVVLLTIGAAFMLGPWFEVTLFGGDSIIWLREVLGLDYAQRNALVVGLIMGLAVIPVMFSIAEEAIHGVPDHLVNGSLALGATRWQTLTRVVLLTAGPGIFSAIMVGMGRAVGETMIVLMATGNTPIMDLNLFEGMRTFAANIAVELPESEVDSSHFRILFLTALVLFVITFALNTIAELVREKLRSHYGRL